MSFNSVKKQTYNTINSTLNVVSTTVGAVDKAVAIADDYLAETLAVRRAGADKRMEQKLLQAERDAIVDSQESVVEFHKAILKNEEQLNLIKEKLSEDSLEKYKHLL